MKKFVLSCLAAGLSLSAAAQTVAPAIPYDKEVEQQVEKLMKKMTLY